MKTVRRAAIAGVLLLMVSWVAAQTPTDRPPNVPAESWIPISNSLGIVIVNIDSTPARTVFRFEPNEQRIIPLIQSGTGVLMAKYNGVWTRIDLAAPPLQRQPLGL